MIMIGDLPVRKMGKKIKQVKIVKLTEPDDLLNLQSTQN